MGVSQFCGDVSLAHTVTVWWLTNSEVNHVGLSGVVIAVRICGLYCLIRPTTIEESIIGV